VFEGLACRIDKTSSKSGLQELEKELLNCRSPRPDLLVLEIY
jgi:hypothetical protein